MSSTRAQADENTKAPAPTGVGLAAVEMEIKQRVSKGIAMSNRTAHKVAYQISKRVGKMDNEDLLTAEQMVEQYHKSGEPYTKAELMHVIRDMQASKKSNRLLWRILCAVLIAMVLLVAAIFATSYLAGEAIKESHVAKGGLMTDKLGNTIKTSTTSYKLDLFELPNLDYQTVQQIKLLSVVVDGRNSTTFDDDVVAATFTVTSVVRYTKVSQLAFYTPSGAVIKLSGATKSGTITIDGATLPVFSEADDIVDYNTDSPGRRLIVIPPPKEGAGANVDSCPKGRTPFYMAVINRWICIGTVQSVESGSKETKSSSSSSSKTEAGAPVTPSPSPPRAPPPPAKCVQNQAPLDQDRRCSDWAEKGFCTNEDYKVATTGEKYSVYIPRKCACSCNVDGALDGDATKPDPPKPSTCIDDDKKGRCPQWAADGYCTSTAMASTGETYAEHMTNRCRISCPQPKGSECA